MEAYYIAEMPSHMHDMADNDAGYYTGWGTRSGWASQSVNTNSGGRYFTAIF